MHAPLTSERRQAVKRRDRDPRGYDALRAFYESTGDSSTREGGALDAEFLRRMSEIVKQHSSNPIVVHGLRTQAMFAHVIAALGGCRFIKEEDAGQSFSTEDDLRPDFHILTLAGEQFFVEVKNHRPRAAFREFRLRLDYLTRLRRYAEVFSLPLKIAVYWSGWGWWTLVDARQFDVHANHAVLSLPDATKRSEMALLGDLWVGIDPPLALRVVADPAKPRSVQPDGRCSFTIARVVMAAGGVEVLDPAERAIARFLFWHGRWADVVNRAAIVDGELSHVDLEGLPPEEWARDRGPYIVGALSEMFSRRFNLLTTLKGEVVRLEPQVGQDRLGIVIPRDYSGTALKLWRFEQRPALPHPTEPPQE